MESTQINKANENITIIKTLTGATSPITKKLENNCIHYYLLVGIDSIYPTLFAHGVPLYLHLPANITIHVSVRLNFFPEIQVNALLNTPY